MKDLLTAKGRRALARFIKAHPELLIALDFDGTLVGLSKRPENVYLLPAMERRLIKLSKRYPLVMLTGRSRTDILKRLGKVPFKYVVGNHGMEGAPKGKDPSRWSQLVRGWKTKLTPLSREFSGLELEDKKYSISIHYRNAKNVAAARAATEKLIAKLPRAAIVPGKFVYNLVPKGAPNKGVALTQILSQGAYSAALFVGDDVTDETAFRHRQVRGKPIFSVRVGKSKDSAAPYFVKDRSEVGRLISLLLKSKWEG